jgi:hypothetical protein
MSPGLDSVRRWLPTAAEAAVVLGAVFLLVLGVVGWSGAANDATKTRTAAREAEAWQERSHRRLTEQQSARRTLVDRLRKKQATLRALTKQAGTDFSEARAAGWRAGERAGRAAGASAGRREALHSGRLAGSDDGWYFVKIRWSYGLPVVDEYWMLDEGAESAYYVSEGTAFHRDTTG